MKKIILTGSLAFDYIFDIPNQFSDYIQPDKLHQINISITCETFKKSFGGTAGNQAYYLGLLDTEPCILASVGYDFQEYKDFLTKNKVNTDYIKIDESLPTAAGHVITDKKDNQIWMFAKGAMKNADKLKIIDVITGHSRVGGNPINNGHLDNWIPGQARNDKQGKNNSFFILISPTDPTAMVNHINECIDKKIDFAFDPAFYIPVLPAGILKKAISHAHIIFGNDYEIAFLEKRIGQNVLGLLKKDQILVKTLGDKGSEIYQNQKKYIIEIYKTNVIDPTGAGDAYRAGFLYGYLNGKAIKDCGKMGAVTSSFAVEIKGTMNPKFTKNTFESRLNTIR